MIEILQLLTTLRDMAFLGLDLKKKKKKPRLENVTPPAAATSYLPQYCHQTASFPLQWIIWDRLYSPGRDSCYICYRLRSWKALQSAPPPPSKS